MNGDDIIRMAREAQLAYGSDEMILPSVERFAALIAAAEREACAKACEALNDARCGINGYGCAVIIRARGEK